MDLQAILAASDSSDDGNGGGTGGGENESSLQTTQNRYSDVSNATNNSSANANDAMDLEQILREDDDDNVNNIDGDEDSLDNNVISNNNNNNNNTGHGHHHRGVWESKGYGSSVSTDDEDDDLLYAAGRASRQHQQRNSHHRHRTIAVGDSFASSHNAEDWAVLQAILQEADDNDDDNDDDDDIDDENYGDHHQLEETDDYWLLDDTNDHINLRHHVASSTSASQDHHHGRGINVDEILRASQDEDDDDEEDVDTTGLRILNTATTSSGGGGGARLEDTSTFSISLLPTTSTMSPSGVGTPSSSQQRQHLHNVKKDAGSSSIMLVSNKATAGSNGYSNSSASSNKYVSPERQGNNNNNYATDTAMKDKEDFDTTNTRLRKIVAQSEEWLEKETSQRAMANAQAYERRLLKSTGTHTREIVSPLMVKRRLKPKIELFSRTINNNSGSGAAAAGVHSATHTTTASGSSSTLLLSQHHQTRQQLHYKKKKQSAAERLTASVMPRFGFSGIVENKTMSDISKSMSDHCVSESFKVHCGLATCLANNSKFIAVGTQKGYILLYDLFEVLRQRLDTASLDDHYGAKKAGSITSLDLSYNGEVVVAGYESGLLLLWDTIKGTVLRSVTDNSHLSSPITSVRFLTDLKMVTVDAAGLVNKLTFSRNILWSSLSLETDCLLDGTAGQILAMNVLPPFASVNPLVRPSDASFSRVLQSLTLIALSSERSSFAVACDPKVHVLHRWARPSPERMNAVEAFGGDWPNNNNVGGGGGHQYLPCLTWGWALSSGGRNVVMPALARAWGCCLQLLCASFPTLDDGNNNSSSGGLLGGGENNQQNQQMHWPAFGEHEEIDTIAPVVALEWLNDRSLVYLTVTNEFCVVDTVMMTLLERLDFSGLKLVYAEFTLSRNSAASEAAANNQDGSATSNNINDSLSSSACATTFQNSLRCSDDRLMLLCREEIKCISIVSARRRITSLEEDGEWLEALALALDHYESTVVSQEDKKRDQSGRKDLSRHPEFSGPKSEDEEWIAKLLTRYINLAVDNAPESSRPSQANGYSPGGGARIDLAQSHFQMLAGVCVEFCVVTRRLDLLFGPIFRRFQSVGYTSVFLDVLEPYVLSDKLGYIAPEVMAFFVEHCKATNGIATVERCLLHMDCTIMDFDSILSLLRANEMYSALFYVFNQGLSDYVTPLELLLERVFDEAETGSVTKKRRRDGTFQTPFERFGYKAILYLQTCFYGKTFPQEKELLPDERKQSVRNELVNFLTRDSFQPSPHFKRPGGFSAIVGQRALLYPYMRLLLLVDPKIMLDTISLAIDAPETNIIGSRPTSAEDWLDENTPSGDKQEMMTVLASIVLPTPGGLESLAIHSPSLVNAFLDFTAKYLLSSAVLVDKEIVFMIIRRMADRFVASKDPAHREQAQRQIMDLLSALPRDSYEPDKVLDLIGRSGIHRAALLLHQQVASPWHEDSSRDIELRSRHFRCAIDCYLEDHDALFRREVFEYVKKECSGVVNSSGVHPGDEPASLRDALFAKLPALVNLDPLLTARLVAELFVDDLDRVVESLESDADGGKLLFRFFQAIISGALVEVDPVAGSVLNLTMEHHHRYLALMAKLHPEEVYDYLSTHDNYRAEECLKLCQEFDIADASAYLLERLGNVSSALQLILQTLESRMMNLKRTIRGMGIEVFRQQSTRHLLRNRKSYGLASAELSSSQAKDVERVKRILVVALDLCERNSGTLSSRSEHGSQLWFNVLDRLINAKGFLRLSKEQPEHAKVMAGVLSELLQLTMQRMVSSVPLTDLVRKVTSDHSGSRLGELREMVESLLGTYGFELKLFEGAITVFHQDVYRMQNHHRSLRLQASSVRSVMTVPLVAENTESIRGYLRRSSHLDMALQASSHGNAALIENESLPYSRRVEGGLGSALSKLRSRRGASGAPSRGSAGGGSRCTVSGSGGTGTRRGLNMMTSTEQLYQSGEIEPVIHGARPVGALGQAEHRGRLMTFH